MFNINFCGWLDLNYGPLDLEATALPTEPQPLPNFLDYFEMSCFKSKLKWLLFGQLLDEIGLRFMQTSGHTGRNSPGRRLKNVPVPPTLESDQIYINFCCLFGHAECCNKGKHTEGRHWPVDRPAPTIRWPWVRIWIYQLLFAFHE